jgi:hypothetical protein
LTPISISAENHLLVRYFAHAFWSMIATWQTGKDM